MVDGELPPPDADLRLRIDSKMVGGALLSAEWARGVSPDAPLGSTDL